MSTENAMTPLNGTELPAPQPEVMGFPIAAIHPLAAARHLVRRLQQSRGGYVVTVNVDILRQAHHDRRAATILREADLLVADGWPVVAASRLAGDPLPGRVCGSDVLPALAREAAELGLTLCVMGGQPGAPQLAATRLAEQNPGLRIIGIDIPYDHDTDTAARHTLQAKVREHAPDFVLVGMGFPRQELFCRDLLEVHPEALYIGVGAAVEFEAGLRRRAPEWVRNVRMEWLFRLWQEPRRLFRRYVVDGVPFAARLFAWALRVRLRERRVSGR